MKSTLRIPTTESYAYIEVEFEGTDEEIITKYREFTKTVQGGFGLEEKEFNRVLDSYIPVGGSMRPDEYEAMSPSQQELIQTIKRSKKRTASKLTKTTE